MLSGCVDTPDLSVDARRDAVRGPAEVAACELAIAIHDARAEVDRAGEQAAFEELARVGPEAVVEDAATVAEDMSTEPSATDPTEAPDGESADGDDSPGGAGPDQAAGTVSEDDFDTAASAGAARNERAEVAAAARERVGEWARLNCSVRIDGSSPLERGAPNGNAPSADSETITFDDVMAGVAALHDGDDAGWWTGPVEGSLGVGDDSITVEVVTGLVGDDAVAACDDVYSALAGVRPLVVVYVTDTGRAIHAAALDGEPCVGVDAFPT